MSGVTKNLCCCCCCWCDGLLLAEAASLLLPVVLLLLLPLWRQILRSANSSVIHIIQTCCTSRILCIIMDSNARTLGGCSCTLLLQGHAMPAALSSAAAAALASLLAAASTAGGCALTLFLLPLLLLALAA
jgi:hypothetical protein